MSRGLLAIGAGAVIVAAFGLYILLGADTADAPALPDRGQKIADPGAGKTRIPRSPRPGDPDPSPRTGPAEPTDRTIGERIVRDHRAGEHVQSPSDLPPASDHPVVVEMPGRKIDPKVNTGLSQQLRPALRDCAANLAPEVFGKKSRIEGQITISIKDHQTTITGASFELRDVAEAAQATIKQCLMQRAVGTTAPAGDEADVEGYPVSLSLAWP
jgi:hypothetical protein